METEGRTIREVEKEMILRALERHNGSRTAVAKELGVSTRTIANKLKTYGVTLQEVVKVLEKPLSKFEGITKLRD